MGDSKTPVVSVITATYNWSSVLHYAIRSVLWQTFEDFEHLIIGDGCTDDSEDVVAAFNDPRLIWHNLPANTGNQSLPNNKGLELSCGKYVAYLGHDDVWYPSHLEVLVKTLESSEADLAHTMVEIIGAPETGERYIRGGVSWADRITPWIPPSCIMHRRKMVEDIGYWKEYRTIDFPPDREFITRAYTGGKQFTRVPELTVFKFPSGMRKDSYKKKESGEQAAIVRRIETDPDFRYRELVEVSLYEQAKSAVQERPPEDISLRWLLYRQKRIVINSFDAFRQWLRPYFLPLGWETESWRQIRGLDSKDLHKPSLKHFFARLKKLF